MMKERFNVLLIVIMLQVCIGIVNNTDINRNRRLDEYKRPTGLKWSTCCEGYDVRNIKDQRKVSQSSKNYVWPMMTSERLYFLVSGMQKLFATAKSSKYFKIVEPNTKDTQLSITGVPLSTYVTFTDFDDYFVTRKTWNYETHTSDSRYEEPVEPSDFSNVILLVPFELEPGEKFWCSGTLDETELCYSFDSSDRKIYVQFSKEKNYNFDAWVKLFGLIRSSKFGLSKNYDDPKTPVTIGLTDWWYKPLEESGMVMDMGSWTDSISSGEGIKLSPFLLTAGKFALNTDYSQPTKKESSGNGKVSVALAWRMQRQYSRDMIQELDQVELETYITGCQVVTLINQLSSYYNKNIMLIFDIFANDGQGADTDLGPSPAVRRGIVQHFQDSFNFVLVMAGVKKRIGGSMLDDLDPHYLTVPDRNGFMAWLDISMGAQIDTYIHAGM